MLADRCYAKPRSIFITFPPVNFPVFLICYVSEFWEYPTSIVQITAGMVLDKSGRKLVAK
jgi:hypothetical protein